MPHRSPQCLRAGRRWPSIYESLEARRLLSVNVTTYHYDNSRDGANTSETVLTTSNVNDTTFGKVASFAVDAQVYAQPLVMTDVAVSGQGTHDIVLVATENDSVYAFDAEGNNPPQGYLWKTSLLQTGETAVPQTDYSTTDITPLIGITGTPVINPATGIIYVVGAFKESNSSYRQRLYALNISTGTNAIAPVTITASVAGTGYGSSNGMVSFSPFWENQRPALTLANGQVYVAWSSHGDLNPWHGWVMAYNASTLAQDYVYCDTADGDAGGIWMSGGGIAVDSSGNLYFTTGNGTFDANTGGIDYGMSIEKLSPTLSVEDYFAPYNELPLSNADLDYGCSSVILLPTQSGADPDEILTESKWGTMYLNDGDTGELGEFNPNGTGPNDDLGEASIGGNLHNTLSYWDGHAYVGGDGLNLKLYNVAGGTLATSPSSQSAQVFGSASDMDGQGTGPTISSNGTGNGIVWAVDNSGFNANPAVLYAYNANNLSDLLYSSNQAANGRDTCGDAVKFQDAVVANGYVYVGGAGSVTVYGLLATSPRRPTVVTAPVASPSPVTGTTTNLNALATDPTGDALPIYTWAASNIPNGATTPIFSVNGTNGANAISATFYQAGSYTFTLTMEDPSSTLTTTSTVNVTVDQTLTGINLTPAGSVSIASGQTQQFTATGTDQFGQTMSSEPAFTWSVIGTGAGTISTGGLYQAPANGTGSAIVQAASGGVEGQATVALPLPGWLAAGSSAIWNSSTDMLNVTGAVSIIADPGAAEPIIIANGSSAIITINPSSALQIHLGGLSLTNGASAIVTSLGSARTTINHRVLILGQPGAITTPLLTIDSTSKLDLADNDLIDHDGSYATLNNLLTTGFNAGAGYWNGPGIDSSIAATGNQFALGDGIPTAAETVDSETVGTGDVIVRYTYYGDTNLDGRVNASDYTAINNGFLNQLTGFGNGDFNYDGIINGSDYTLIDNAVNTNGAALDSQIAKSTAQIFARPATYVDPAYSTDADPSENQHHHRRRFSDVKILPTDSTA